MNQKVCIITGAKSSLGKAAAVQIAQKGYRVVMACRNWEHGEAARQDVLRSSGCAAVELMILDLSLHSSIKGFSGEFLDKHKGVDVLIHNAAAFDTR